MFYPAPGSRELDLLLRVGSISTLVRCLRSCEIRFQGKGAGENDPNLLWSEYVNFGSGNIRRIMALRQRKTGADGEDKEPLLDGVDRSASPSRGRDELPEAFGQVILNIQNYLSLIGPYARYVKYVCDATLNQCFTFY